VAITKIIFALILLILPSLSFCIDLTEDEKNFIQNEIVRVCVDPDWYPYEKINSEGEYIGIVADLFKVMASRVNLKYTIMKTSDWEETMTLSKNGKCDLIAGMNETPERQKKFLFTSSYFDDPNIIVIREDDNYISDFKELKDKSIAIPTETNIFEIIETNYPNLKIIPTKSEKEAFELVSSKKADITLRPLTMAVYTIKNYGFFNLKIGGELPREISQNSLKSAVRNDLPILRDIINKSISTITPQEARKIANDHASIKVDYRIDYKLIFYLSLIFGSILGIIILWLLHTRQLNEKLQKLRAELLFKLQENEKLTNALKESEHSHQKILESSHVGISVIQDGKIVYFNHALTEITGYSPEELNNMNYITNIYPDDKELVSTIHKKRLANEDVPKFLTFRIKRKDGQIIWLETSGSLFEWQDKPAVINFISDITLRVEKTNRIKHAAEHDFLTKLPNRLLLKDRVEQSILFSRRDNINFAFIFVDINHFKKVNDTYGHEIGDLLLVDIAKRLKHLFRETDTVARVAGDEFVIILNNFKDIEDDNKIIDKIKSTIGEPYTLSNILINITCAVGLAIYPLHGNTIEELYRYSDVRMYQDKKSSKI